MTEEAAPGRSAGGPALDRRIDPMTGREVVVVADRQGRPNLPAGDCPFCPGGLEAPAPYDVRWFPNRWPPLGAGRAEVVLYTSHHKGAFASLGREGARRVVDLWADRTGALGAEDDVGYVLIFENRGADVGATIDHPHGQIYAFPDVPEVPRTELAAPGPCHLCGHDPGPLEVCADGGWRAWVPGAAEWPYALLLAPVDHVADLPSLDLAGRDGMAGVLLDALGRLDRLFGAPMPYMLWIHQRPTDGGRWPESHVHVHVAPLRRAPGVTRFVAAGELGSGTSFNPVDPAAAAAALRNAGSTLHA